MMRERLRSWMISCLLAWVISAGSVFCLLTGFCLKLESLSALLLVWGIWAPVCGILFTARRGGAWVLCVLAAAAGYLWRQGDALEQTRAMLWQISVAYDRVYRWGVLILPETVKNLVFIDLPVGIWGVLTETLVCGSVCRRGYTAHVVMLAVVPLGVCMVTPETVPALWALFLLLAGLAVLVFTGGVRRESCQQGNRLTLAAAIPLIAAVGLLFLAFPKETYVDRSEGLRSLIQSYAEGIPGMLPEPDEGILYAPQAVPDSRVDLAGLVGQSAQEIPVMKVTAQKNESLYLRGQDYEEYSGTGWASGGSRSEDFSGWGIPEEQITVCTFGLHELMYVPYFPGGTELHGGILRNTGHVLEYTVTRYPMGSAVGEETLRRCLQLPPATLAAVKKWLPTGELSPGQLAEEIQKRVSTSATYDRETGKMPDQEPDFAVWFLEQSDTGYCVHFATAAVVLLRAAGVPARYVTGYKTETAAGEEVVVTTLQAHAWAEYFDPGMGNWVVLEATPADPGQPETPPEKEAGAQTGENAEAETEQALPEQREETETAEPNGGSAQPHLLRRTGEAALALILAAAILVLRRWMLLALRRWRRNRSGANSRALLYWQETERMAGLLREQMPETLTELAEKARFSQHGLEPEELTCFMAYRQQCLKRLKEKNLCRRLLHRYVLVVY